MTLRDEYWDWVVPSAGQKRQDHPDKAKNILFNIVEDFTDRRGLRQEWEQIDNGIQEEILQTWLKIIQANL